jgi:hypothetical protein
LVVEERSRGGCGRFWDLNTLHWIAAKRTVIALSVDGLDCN